MKFHRVLKSNTLGERLPARMKDSVGSSTVTWHPLRFACADAGFARQLVDWCQRSRRSTLHIVRKAPGHQGSQ